MKLNRTILFVMGYVFFLGVFSFAGYFFFVDYQMRVGKLSHTQGNSPPDSNLAYIDLPRIAVTLTSSGSNLSGSVRMDIQLAVEGQYATKVQGYRERITDGIVRYTQTLDYADLSRPKATVRLKPDVLRVVNATSAPVPVRDLVFREFVVF